MTLLYLKEFDFEKRTNPRKHPECLTIMNHPENVFTDDLIYNKVDVPEDCRDDVLYGYSPIRCNVILTNPEHDGIWLYRNKHNELTLLSKDMDYCYHDMVKHDRIWYAIAEAMIDTIDYNGKYPSMMNSPFDSRKFELSLMNGFVLTLAGLIPNTFYNYYLSKDEINGRYKRRIDLFIICEVEEPNPLPLPFTNYEWMNLIWYSRKEHSSLAGKNPSIFKHSMDMGYKYDIRFDGDGPMLLDRIFNTKEVFGKLDIY